MSEQTPAIPYTKAEEKELDATMHNVNSLDYATVRARFELRRLEKYRYQSEAGFLAWADAYRLVKRGPVANREPIDGATDPTEKEIRARRVIFEREEAKRKQAAEARKRAEEKAREQEKLTAVLSRWIEKETPIRLAYQSWGIAGHLAGHVQRFSGFIKAAVPTPAWLLFGCDSGDKRDLFWVFDLTATGWVLYGEGKEHRLVISTEGKGEITISDHAVTDEEFKELFGAATEVLVSE